ncbi:Cif family virulence factor [Pseudochryseolinea flava]|uniref:Nuclear transport factor 2 family protein n=1 Tax=Pseudochryseolinea flava TaxID=2059302 RepID=A0A364Y749_9BACT|nr:hypothetical protein [Pseudochryseolinea flava]RAW02723.1 hypothetical protein DQQ10_01045 [Pseudochryseolinea flava]
MKNLISTALLLGLVVLVRAQEFEDKNLQSLVETEIDFATLAKKKNNREAFLANVDQQSITLSEKIQSTKSNWENTPVDSMWLNWYPSFADISIRGDMGYTYGPWSGHPSKTSAAQFGGHYVTIWKKQSDGAWKIAIDAGINYETFALVSTHPVKTTNLESKSRAKTVNAKKELLETDIALQKSLKRDGAKAYQSVISTEIKFFRQNHAPFTVIDVEKIGTIGTVGQHACDVSSAGDFGYTYGLHEIQTGPTNARTFLRIWKKQDGKTWKLVFDAAF